MNEMVERVADKLADRAVYCPGFSLGEIARIVIAAMREPTEAMAAAAFDTGVVVEEVIWKAMIDEALREDEVR